MFERYSRTALAILTTASLTACQKPQTPEKPPTPVAPVMQQPRVLITPIPATSVIDPYCDYIGWDLEKNNYILPSEPEQYSDTYIIQLPMIHQNGFSEGCARFELPEGINNQGEGSLTMSIYQGYMSTGSGLKQAQINLPTGLFVDTTINTQARPIAYISSRIAIMNHLSTPYVNVFHLSDWISGFSYKIFWKQYRFFKEHILGKEQAIPVPNIPTPNIPVPEGPRIPGKTV